jgi:CRP-like cAMP-binding protein
MYMDARQTAGNLLLDRLPAVQRARLLECCELRALSAGTELGFGDGGLRALVFPTAGAVSESPGGDEHGALQLALVGPEGMLGAALMLSSRGSTLRTIVRIEGTALFLLQTRWNEARRAVPQLPGLAECALCLQSQLFARAAVCLRYHSAESRLARWLLAAADRAAQPSIDITHERLAELLGLRRSGVTVCAGQLQSRGLIDYHRGEIRLLDPVGLLAASCPCYAQDRASVSAAFAAALAAPPARRLAHRVRVKHAGLSRAGPDSFHLPHAH